MSPYIPPVSSNTCPACHTANRDGAKFCSKCGNKLAAAVQPPAHPPVYPSTPPKPPQPSPEAYTPPVYTPPIQNNPASYSPVASSPPYKPPVAYPSFAPPAFRGYDTPAQTSAKPQSGLNLSQALGFPFQSPNWLGTLLIGGVLFIVPLGIIFNGGFYLEVMRRTLNEHPEPMPVWDEWGQKFKDGLILFALTFIYVFVILILFSLPGLLITLVGEEETGGLIGIVGALLGTLFIYLLLPLGLGQYAESGHFMDGLNIPKAFGRILNNPFRYIGNCLLAFFALFVGIFIISLVNAIGAVLIIGLICTIPITLMVSFYLALYQYNLIAQLYKTTL
ncbi:MAG: DUF4013 domain-containing protein [Chloroflexi bacterium]|nr:DUF4013 domain-containing protein [Chloroflexota bacterium]MBP8059216.1 DUF4013 domain-containing protein [Chloroflexota bacterium]